MSGSRVWVDENDLRLVLQAFQITSGVVDIRAMEEAAGRLRVVLDPPVPPPLRPYRANMQGHGA